MGCWMFQDKYSFRVQNFGGEYQVGEFRQPPMVVWRVGKDYIKALDRLFQESEAIPPDDGDLVQFHLSATVLYEIEMPGSKLQRYNRTGTPGSKFVGDNARTGKQVKNIHLFKIILMYQDIEEAFPGKISGGSGSERFGRMDLLAPVFSTDYAHLLPSDRIMYRSMLTLDKASR